MNTKAISAMIQTHKLSCITRRKGNFVCSCGRDAAEAELAAMQARIKKLEEVARVAGFIELNRHNYLFNGRQEADKASVYYMDLLKEKLDALKGE